MRILLVLLILLTRVAGAADITPYNNRFGREQPVVAVVGENHGTELTDFFIPYGVLARSGAVRLLALATEAGPMTMLPALTIQPDASIAEFDLRFPDGADYVIVPAVAKYKNPALLAWITAQAAKGATLVSICDGVLVVANTGLLKGRRATGHFGSASLRQKDYPDTQWLANVRYVADGTIISSAGVSAAVPTALALVEAIAGTERAADVARQIGASDWSSRHDSEVFAPRLGTNLTAYATAYTNHWFHSTEKLGLPVAAGVDEIALALRADAWSRSKRSRIYALADSAAPLPTLHGLTLVPDSVTGAADAPALLPPAALGETAPVQALDQALAAIAERYGRRTAWLVALELEYPSYR